MINKEHINIKHTLHYYVIEDLIRKFYGEDPSINYLIIGVAEGRMEKNLIEKFKNIKIISIDNGSNPFSVDEQKRIKFINKHSDEAHKDIEKGTVDFIYIDGGHTYEQCKKDILNYLPLLKNRGIFGGHDFHNAHGVIQAVEEIFGLVTLSDDLTWWFVKDDINIF